MVGRGRQRFQRKYYMYGAYILEKEKDKCTVQLILIREKLEEKYYEICEEKVRERKRECCVIWVVRVGLF